MQTKFEWKKCQRSQVKKARLIFHLLDCYGNKWEITAVRWMHIFQVSVTLKSWHYTWYYTPTTSKNNFCVHLISAEILFMRKNPQNAREVSLVSLTLRTRRLYHSMHATENHCSLLKCEEVKSLTTTRNKKLLFNRGEECDFTLQFLFYFSSAHPSLVYQRSIGLYICLYPETVYWILRSVF